jgi:predicted P-loop ATPase
MSDFYITTHSFADRILMFFWHYKDLHILNIVIFLCTKFQYPPPKGFMKSCEDKWTDTQMDDSCTALICPYFYAGALKILFTLYILSKISEVL